MGARRWRETPIQPFPNGEGHFLYPNHPAPQNTSPIAR